MAIRCLRGGARAHTEGGARAQDQFSQRALKISAFSTAIVLRHGGGVAVGSWIYIYIYILAWYLCIYMHKESGSDSEVDAIVKLIWSKA